MGASLLAIAVAHSTLILVMMAPSRASSLPQRDHRFQINPAPHQANDNSSYSNSYPLLDFAPLFCSSCRIPDALAASSLVRTVSGPGPECLR
ncbi:hypothetical protein C1X64_00555 [Pseudomonas sp. GW456-E7]|nr:hypothetical protein C1X64_00555 [Pseudomonas sp. GW456-E7]